MTTPKLDHMVLLVSSRAASEPYYSALLPLLGFSKFDDTRWRHKDGLILQFLEARTGTRPYERYGAGLNHMGFRVDNAAAVDAVRNGMITAGFDAPEIQMLDGAPALFMKDPDGVRFEISYFPPEIDLQQR